MESAASRQIFWAAHDLVRYIKLQIDAVAGVEIGNGKIMQISELRFITPSGKSFAWNYDAATCIDYTRSLTTGITGKWYTKAMGGECAERLLDNDVTTKFCCKYTTLPFYVTFDLGGECLDIARYNRYQWWTANDQSEYPTRSPISWQLLVADGGEISHQSTKSRTTRSAMCKTMQLATQAAA